jgi:hypothetical protein
MDEDAATSSYWVCRRAEIEGKRFSGKTEANLSKQMHQLETVYATNARTLALIKTKLSHN